MDPLFQIIYETGWDQYYSKMDLSIQQQILKKLEQLHYLPKARHLGYGSPHFVAEVGQYRIVFDQEGTVRTILFVGNHKQYERWYQNR